MGPATGLWRLHGDPALRIPPAHAWQPFKQGPHSALFRLDAAQPITPQALFDGLSTRYTSYIEQ